MVKSYLSFHPETEKVLVDNLRGTVSRLVTDEGWLAYSIDTSSEPPGLNPVELGDGKQVATTQEFELLDESGEAIGSGRVTNDIPAS